jgi:hypothetical protein
MLLLCVQIHALNEGCLCCVGRLCYTIHGVPLVSTGLLRMYTGKKWVGDEWGGRIYTGQKWVGDKWGGRIYTGQKWVGDEWGGRIYTGQNWMGEKWGGRFYTGQMWVGDVWGGRIYTGTIVMYVGEASADPSADPLAMSGVGNSWVVALPGSVRMSMH